MLENPEFMSIAEMNHELAEICVNKLQTMSPNTLEKYQVIPIIELLKQQKNAMVGMNQFRDYMSKLDTIRNQKFSDTHKEIAKIIYKNVTT
jgi:hypothetical protein